MTYKTNKNPKLRFPEFRDEWQETNLGSISNRPTYGMNAASKAFDGNNIYLRITDIDESTHRLIRSGLTSPEGILDDSFKLQEGDLLFTRTGASTGKTYLYSKDDGDLYFAGFLIKFSIKNVVPYFVFTQTLLDRYKRWVKEVSMRSGQPGINANEYAKFRVDLPSRSEQQKIASFLSSVDNWINNLKSQKESLEKYKKGIMQKIFSREIRFKDENGNDYPKWETLKAGDIFENYTNKNHSSDLPLLAVTQNQGVVYRDDLALKINSSEKGIKDYKIIEPGNFVISLRSFQGGLEYSNILGISSPAYTILKSKLKIADGFFKYLFKTESFINKLNQLIYGIRDGKQISYSEFKSLNLLFPSLSEQQEIANFLVSLDKLIEAKEGEIIKAETWKNGLMQGLFI